MPQDKILIIEDEPKIAQLIADFLELDAYETSIVSDGAIAIDKIKTYEPNCVILDLMLPNKDGLEICKELREFSNVPVIMLTARVDEIDRLKGLKSGADDYVCKPFSPREIVARVDAILRRERSYQETKTSNTFHYKQISLDVDAFACKIEDSIVDLTPVEFRLLLALVKSPGAVLSRDQLMTHCYQDGRVVSDRTIDSHMKNVKHKLHKVLPDDQFIQAVYGVGYKLI
ncbi:response regulator [Glaciecola sp. MH2013]|uniref:response regulator n=1 Tax=Glaciecola sp. MH2013 TaxID=2785524 RepID=UPI00189CCC36|nr:response regulator [Glaciecola sp. MH2013]MBF7074257.1 response regulator [Glaciecola sp. MH2013]